MRAGALVGLARRTLIDFMRRGLEELLRTPLEDPRRALARALESVAVANLYVHIPFCIKPCTFCCFTRFKYEPRTYKEYMKALHLELEEYADLAGDKVVSAYIGGGTPTINREGLLELLDAMVSMFPRLSEISVEAHPATLDEDLVIEMRRRGVDRLSIGVQSLDVEVLKSLGRTTHDPETALKAVEAAAGKVPTLNVDLIFGLPELKGESVVGDALRLVELGANEVTFYPLLVAWGEERYGARRVREEAEEEQYKVILSRMLESGMTPMTPWCFAKPGTTAIDEYIVVTPHYLAAGLSSIGKLGRLVYVNTFSVKKYVELVAARKLSATRAKHLSEVEEAGYDALMEAFGLKLRSETVGRLGPLSGLVKAAVLTFMRGEGGAYRPKSFKGFLVIHKLMKDFLEGVAWLRRRASELGV